MQVFHTAGEPPSSGSTMRLNTGWTRKSRNALQNTAHAYAPRTAAGAARRAMAGGACCSMVLTLSVPWLPGS